VPVTLLSGFLGSGKTTTLQHLLENTDGLRIGVIVNDMASVNIDAKLVKNSDSMTSKSSSSTPTSTSSSNGVVELQNGCACCSLADELLSTVENLVDSRTTTEPFDAIVVELSGVADPIAIQSNWVNAQLNKHSVTTKADMKRIVTLIDSSTFGTDWMTWDSVGEREGWIENTSGTVGEEDADSCASQRKVPELLAEQIEAADILLLNKIDIAGPEQVKIASVLARQINENAIIEEVEFGKVTSPKQIIRDDIINCSDHNPTNDDCADPGCTDETHDHSHSSHSHSKSTSTDNLGIINFVYKADRPFETRNLMSLLNTWPVPIKENLNDLLQYEQDGFCWLAPTKHDTAMYWSHAGRHFGISTAGKWWATLPNEQMKEYFEDDTNEYDRIMEEDFQKDSKWGDRRQEIVFIGININEAEITKALDNCLIGD
ncbi:cobW-domain-containing protein, partial [Fragilariopsis cylindrus CCMP1102]